MTQATIKAALISTLGALVSSRCFENRFPQAPALQVWPAIRVSKVSNVHGVDLCGGDDDTADPTWQIDIVSETTLALDTLRTQVIAAMATFDPPAIPDGEFNEYDPETKTHRCGLHYIIYPSSEA